MSTNTTAFKFWKKLHKTAFGRWLFSKILCVKAPYFSTVSPRIAALEQNLCEGSITQRRGIQNHIGSVMP